jgi:site-specific recombinase XerC
VPGDAPAGVRRLLLPPRVEEIVAMMRQAADDRHGWRLRAIVVVLWRAGLRVQEALALAKHGLHVRRGSVRVRNGKGGRRPEVGIGRVGLAAAAPMAQRTGRAAGRLAVLHHRRPHARATVVRRRGPLRVAPAGRQAGVRRRFAPHQLRNAHALELAREGVPLNIIQR